MAPPAPAFRAVRVQARGADYICAWEDEGVAMLFRNPQRYSEGVRVVLDVLSSKTGQTTQDGVLYRASLNLLGPRHLSETIKALGRWPLLPWAEAVPWAFRTVYDACIDLGRAVRLRDVPDAPLSYLCDYVCGRRQEGFLLDGDVTGLHGDGASLKGYNALALALALATGEKVGPYVPATCCNVLYLDWESRDRMIRRRVRRLALGVGVDDVPETFFYRSVRGLPLVEALPGILHDLDDLGIGLVVVDSMAMALGVDVKAEAVVPFFTAVRSFPAHVATVVISHVSAVSAADGGSGPARAYGSVQVRNQTRLAYEVKKTAVNGPACTVVLTQEKVNDGPEVNESLGVRLTFEDPEGAVVIEGVSREEAPSLEERLNWRGRVLAVLEGGRRLTTKEIADEVGSTAAVARTTLNRLREGGLLVSLPVEAGQRDVMWGLRAREEV